GSAGGRRPSPRAARGRAARRWAWRRTRRSARRALPHCISSLIQIKQKKGGRMAALLDRGIARLSQAYREIIFSESAAISILPSFSVTSPVTATVWAMCVFFFQAEDGIRDA